jgi:hypothetical protein
MADPNTTQATPQYRRDVLQALEQGTRDTHGQTSKADLPAETSVGQVGLEPTTDGL